MTKRESTRLYVGKTHDGVFVVFRYRSKPTEETHGDKFSHVIGPFRTRAGADYYAKYAGAHNPHLLSVNDAERAVKKGA